MLFTIHTTRANKKIQKNPIKGSAIPIAGEPWYLLVTRAHAFDLQSRLESWRRWAVQARNGADFRPFQHCLTNLGLLSQLGWVPSSLLGWSLVQAGSLGGSHPCW